MGERGGGVRERAFAFAVRVVRLCRRLQGAPVARHPGGQLLRSGTSVGANLEEAHAGQSKRDFVARASIALKEARESLYWLRLLEASGLVPAGRLVSLRAEADELVAILTTILRHARSSPRRGPPVP
ncbi:MAG: four helix bundle protein [Gemmatimonadota bacterium]